MHSTIWLRKILIWVVVRATLVFVCTVGFGVAHAQSDGVIPNAGSTAAGTATKPNTVGKPTEYAAGGVGFITTMNALIHGSVENAVVISHSLRTEADKFAFGLGVITLVLAGVRFASTQNAIAAWTDAIEEIVILGIFVALYLGYDTVAPGFWTWFVTLGTLINGTDVNPAIALGKLAGTIYDSCMAYISAAGWTGVIQIIPSLVPLFFAFLIATLASVVFFYYLVLGQIQAAFGIIIGQIAIALGFSSYTRGFFSKWLDWMITSGMYVVVVACLTRLIGQSINTAIGSVASIGGSTVGGAVYVLDLSIFVFLISFEIPKMAGIFGGGSGLNGGGGVKAARAAAKLVGL